MNMPVEKEKVLMSLMKPFVLLCVAKIETLL